jgi:hypothetical protein
VVAAAPGYTPTPAPAVQADPSPNAREEVWVAHLRREWAENAHGCRSDYVSELVYVAARKRKLTQETGRRWSTWGLGKQEAAEPSKPATPLSPFLQPHNDGFDEVRARAVRDWEAMGDCRQEFTSVELYAHSLLSKAGWKLGKRYGAPTG